MNLFFRLLLYPGLLVSSLSLAAPDNMFPSFEGKVWVPVGNHGSTTVELTGPKQLTTTDGYGPHKEVLTFNAVSGTIERSDFHSNPEPSVSQKTFLSPANGGPFLPYRRQVEEMLSHVVWIQQHLSSLSSEEQAKRAPEVEALLAFFKAELEYLDANATDAIDVSNVPQVFRQGASHKVAIETLAKEKRDLIVRLLDQSGNEVGSWREDVKKGLHNQDFTVEVPDTVAPETKGQLVVSLVPNRGDRETVLVSQKTDIRFGKTEQILNSNAYWVSYTGQPSISLYASYYCPQNCQIQADILSADGKILATKTIPTESPVVPDGAQYTSFELEVQAELFKQGQTYMFRVQLQNVNDAQEILASYSGSFLAGS